MNVDRDAAVSRIAAAIGEPARARMLYCLIGGRARTSTELAIVAGVSPSTASVHLRRLEIERLVAVVVQGRHHYYSLSGAHVAEVLEGLSVIAGGAPGAFLPGAPLRLRAARTCYDHIAGALGVSLHDRFKALRWLSSDSNGLDPAYDVTAAGSKGLAALGIDVEGARALRRRFAYACLDWSERRPHLGGALGAAVLRLALRKRWVTQDADDRALCVTTLGRRELARRVGLDL